MTNDQKDELELVIKNTLREALRDHPHCQAFTEAERVMIKTLALAYSDSTNFLWKTLFRFVIVLAALGAVVALIWKGTIEKIGG